MITPVFALDGREHWLPCGVEESLEAVGVHRDFDKTIASLNFPADMTQPDLPPVVYHEVIFEQRLYWHRFWTWWLYNPKQYAGVGNHEGDWEYVCIATCDEAGDQPILLTYSQHHSGGRLAFWEAQIADHRPIAYVARDSHAHYFHTLKNVEDEANGRGPVFSHVPDVEPGENLYELREAQEQPWWAWEGRWGNSTGEGKSPESPGRQRRHPSLEWSRAR